MHDKPSEVWRGDSDRCAVIIPFQDNFALLANCLSALLNALPPGVRIVLVDDASTAPPEREGVLSSLLSHPSLVLLRHAENRGPGAARNTALAWCWDNSIDTAILLDSDCVPPSDFIETHLALHQQHKDVICAGGAIRGTGESLWARLDGVMSWFTSMPDAPMREVKPPLHIPTTNMSLKLLASRRSLLVFNERLRTGEDVAFVNSLYRAGERLVFSPTPEIVHRNRTDFRGFMHHQYGWGLHTYLVQWGERTHGLPIRLAIATIFLLAAPGYAALATWLNMRH